ncbi:MAG: DUF3592 domain-containing protein [Planctomycetaceae bacterium]|nr:DUF3592 domain-containing protein [Planctomycetaceae bacterium]
MVSGRQQALSVNRTPSILGAWAGYLFGFVFCGGFLTVGSVFLYLLTIGPMLKMSAAKNWQAIPCTIVTSEVGVHRGDDSNTYSVDVTYKYEVNGEEYAGDQYSFFTMNSNSRRWREKVVKQIPPGTQTTCFVNPEDPFEAVLERGWTPDWGWAFFPVPFVLIGLGGFVGIAWHAISSRLMPKANVAQELAGLGDLSSTQERPPRRPAHTDRITAWSQSEFDDDDLEEPPGPVTLQPEQTAMGNFIGLVFISLFWNGILSVFLWQRVGDWMQGQWQWMPELFLVPFVLIGLGLILGVIHSFLALFNPKAVLTLSRQWIPLGGEAELSWTFLGGTASIRKLQVLLEGEEQATYRRGTDTHTDKNQFHSEVLFESSDPLELSDNAGVLITIPGDTMHTLTGKNNKIVWRLRLHGDIPFWPDVKVDFPIRVIPHE